MCVPHTRFLSEDTTSSPTDAHVSVCRLSYAHISGFQRREHSSDRSRDFLPEVGGAGVPRRPTSDPEPWGGTVAGPVYSAVELPRSRGRRGCVQGLINHGRFRRDKQAGPSRDAAAPAADWGGSGGVWTGGRPVGRGTP